MKVRKSIVFDGKMGMRKFWSVALPFGKVACVVKVLSIALIQLLRTSITLFFNTIALIRYNLTYIRL